MGYALATAARNMGARVSLVSGPVNLKVPEGVEYTQVSSAQEMYDTVIAMAGDMDVFIGTAAVADYRPETIADQKIKKTKEDMIVRLARNPDIIASVSALDDKPFTVGFAAETNDVIGYAKDKLTRKKLDMIVANDVSRTDIGFNSDRNEVTVIWAEGSQAIEMGSKDKIAEGIMALVLERLP
jgi:phosphopantothenoylcysteine decarboxylase/phosphopantothenate--cysteine ligase